MDGEAPRRIEYPFDTVPERGAAIPVADGILWMRIPLPMALDHVNVYALDDGDGWTIVDTGIDTRTTRKIWRELIDGPLRGRPVHRVIVTHHHPDHVGLAGWLQTDFDARLLTSRTAWLFARMLSLDEQDAPTAEMMAFWRGAGMPRARLERRAQQRPMNFADVLSPLPLGFTQLAEASRLHAGGRDWTVRLGGGHAPDHVTLWSDDVVIGGDQFLPSISPNLGVYATEPEADPVADWLESCTRFADIASPDHLVLPGHKRPYRGLPTRLDQLTENHHGALQRLEDYLAEPRTAVECFAPLYKRDIGDGEYGLALVEAMAHCLHLWHAGRVTRTKGPEGAWLWHRPR